MVGGLPSVRSFSLLSKVGPTRPAGAPKLGIGNGSGRNGRRRGHRPHHARSEEDGEGRRGMIWSGRRGV